MHGIVLLRPEKPESRDGDDQDAPRLEVLRRPPNGAGVVRDVLEDVEHGEDVERSGQRLRDRVLNDSKCIASLLAKMGDGALVSLRAEHVAEAREHRQVATARAAHLGDAAATGYRRRTEMRDGVPDDVAARPPPPMSVLDGGVNLVLGSLH
jgi:hypothetical protein